MKTTLFLIGMFLISGSVFAEEDLYTLDEAIFQGEIAAMGVIQDLNPSLSQKEMTSNTIQTSEIQTIWNTHEHINAAAWESSSQFVQQPVALPIQPFVWNTMNYKAWTEWQQRVQPPVDPGPVRSYYDEYYADQIKAEVEHAKQMALLEQRQQERQSAAPREAVVIVTEAADSSAAHIEMQTRNARTTASIPNAMTVTQQDTIAQLAAYQLKIDQQAAKLEQQRQEFLHLQTVLVLAVMGSIPLLAALYWTGKQAMHEWRAIQDLRHRQKLEESQAAQKELQAAEHFIEKM